MSTKHRRKWSLEEKVEILHFYQKEGIARTIRQFEVSGTLVYRWHREYQREGDQAFKPGYPRNHELEVSRLEKENKELKSIIAEKELELRIQKEIIKKNRLLNWK